MIVLEHKGVSNSNAVNFLGGLSWQVWANVEDAVVVLTDYTSDFFDNDGDTEVDEADEVYPMSGFAANPSNKPFVVVTDDPKWLQDLNPPANAAAIAAINEYFEVACIECSEITEGNANPSFDFARNKYYDETAANLADVPAQRSAEYWALSVAWCYESYAREVLGPCLTHDRNTYFGDDDPEFEGVPVGPGNQATVLGNVEAIGGKTAHIYLECLRDRGALWQRTTAHEIAHLLKIKHAEYEGTFGEDDKGIMGWAKPMLDWPDEFCWHDWAALKPWEQEYDRFSNNNIKNLRSRAIPWE